MPPRTCLHCNFMFYAVYEAETCKAFPWIVCHNRLFGGEWSWCWEHTSMEVAVVDILWWHTVLRSVIVLSQVYFQKKEFLWNGALLGSYIQLSPTRAWCCFFIVMWLDWSLRSYRATHEIDFGHRLAIAASLYYSTTNGWGCCFQSDKMFTWTAEGCCGRTDWYRCPCLGSGKVDGLYLVTFCCLLPYMTRLCEVEFFCVCICILRSQDKSLKVLKLILSCYELWKSIDIEP